MKMDKKDLAKSVEELKEIEEIKLWKAIYG